MTSKVYVALRVPADPLRAFEAFTDEIALWWQPSGLFQVTMLGDGKLAFEPGVGGRLWTTLDNGDEAAFQYAAQRGGCDTQRGSQLATADVVGLKVYRADEFAWVWGYASPSVIILVA